MKLLIVIVLYETKILNATAIKSLCQNQITNESEIKFLLYDNSKTKSDYNTLKNILIEDYFWDSNNGGVSKAYNYAAEYARANGFDWLLIADQDTFFPENFLQTSTDAINNHPDINLFIPKVRVASKGKFMSPVKNNHYFTKLTDKAPSNIINPAKYAIINSGMLLNVEAFWKVGGYNEKVWLDYSDFQFIERFAKTYNQAFVVDSECIQSFSDDNPDISQKIGRFKLFCSSVKNYQPLNSLNKFWIGFSVLKRAISLSKQSGNLKPLSIFLKNYLR